ncbi:glutathione peroxidase [Telmatocola sphagniphila]|uniref:Glutathione peroxidase n=1 Tax=Telmatocola sphagniphila TaxID=1123043 RepID=A0A8E6ESN2_9BACT|nr:glutathione peroxidase [Telmatocola sphagniphila]QVL31039.1 glutathione peroxidase [Telmatocola sphagniphila]
MSIYDIPLKTIDGQEQTLEPFKGQVLLIVNVASKCGFTPQYAGLEDLYRKYKDKGFAVLGFPCDQFMHQEPGNEAEIQQFCSTKYQVDFPLFAKVKVNGAEANPLWTFLKNARRGFLGTKAIKWNFTKFLVNRQGEVVKRYSTAKSPAKIASGIEAIL